MKTEVKKAIAKKESYHILKTIKELYEFRKLFVKNGDYWNENTKVMKFLISYHLPYDKREENLKKFDC